MFKDPIYNRRVDEKKAVHINDWWKDSVSFVLKCAKATLIRVRQGTDIECNYYIMVFGMNMEKILYRKTQACKVN